MNFKFLSKMLLMGGMIAMTACSSEEPVLDNGNNGDENNDGNVAYMKIRIQSADKMSKAITDGDYEYGSEDEQKVRTVDFFFFDGNGAYMDLSAYLVDPDKADFPLVDPDSGKQPNVEKVFANNLLVLEKLTGNTYPNYMITVINAHDFTCGTNLENTLEKLSHWESTQKDANGKGYFVMSTSSYDDEVTGDTHNPFYHATKLNSTDFYLTPEDAVDNKNAVEVYVERLAAKVQLSVSPTFNSETIVVNGETLYKLGQTVSGGDNTNPDGGNTADTQLYLRVKGWNLNTVAKESYMSKNIDINGWNGFGWTWNKPGDFRSYWAKSTTYGKDYEAIEEYVDYVNSDQLTYAVASPNDATVKAAYCNENTNIAGNVVSTTTVGGTTTYQADSRVATNVVLATQVVDGEGNPVSMISANGVLFHEASYKNYILNRAFIGNAVLNIFVKTNVTVTPGENDESTVREEYSQIGNEYFKSVYPEDATRVGAVEIALDEDMLTADGAEFYYFDSNAAGTAEDPEYKLFDENHTLASEIAIVKEAIAKAQEGSNAVIYENGYNVYYIPVEHLAADKELGLNKDVDGYYGVVRNHWYKLSISSFSKVGHGIWDPTTGEHTETLKPGKPEDPLYYLGATINILSWKVVNQDVEL